MGGNVERILPRPSGQLGHIDIVDDKGKVIQRFIGNRKDRRRFLRDVQRNQRRLSRRADGATR